MWSPQIMSHGFESFEGKNSRKSKWRGRNGRQVGITPEGMFGPSEEGESKHWYIKPQLDSRCRNIPPCLLACGSMFGIHVTSSVLRSLKVPSSICPRLAWAVCAPFALSSLHLPPPLRLALLTRSPAPIDCCRCLLPRLTGYRRVGNNVNVTISPHCLCSFLLLFLVIVDLRAIHTRGKLWARWTTRTQQPRVATLNRRDASSAQPRRVPFACVQSRPSVFKAPSANCPRSFTAALCPLLVFFGVCPENTCAFGVCAAFMCVWRKRCSAHKSSHTHTCRLHGPRTVSHTRRHGRCITVSPRPSCKAAVGVDRNTHACARTRNTHDLSSGFGSGVCVRLSTVKRIIPWT